MNQINNFALTVVLVIVGFTFVITHASAAGYKSQQRSRELTVCDRLKGCFFVNINSRSETLLNGNDTLILDPNNERGYSIRCDVKGTAGAEMDFIKFKYNGTVHDEFATPRYMNGDSNNGDWINTVSYLSTCGMKTVIVEGHVWSTKCFTKRYKINVLNADNTFCQTPPIRSPVASSPMRVPVVSPNQVPVKIPIRVPTKSPISFPVKSPIVVPTPIASVPVACKNNFACPRWSERIPNRECYDSINDCQCISGYRLEGMKCVTACANPFGNPCGPNSSCTDTPTGIFCTDPFIDGCPTGCAFNASCQPRADSLPGYECVCDNGYYNPDPNFAYCAALP